MATIRRNKPASEAAAALQALFPDEAATCLSERLPATARLLDREHDHTARMVNKRLREYTHGRYCAREALGSLGMDARTIAIGRGEDRAPVWPAGVLGSIAHTDELAAAVVGRAGDFAGLGLDVEQAEPLKPELIAMICRPDEQGHSNGDLAKLLFSAKEAVYKCVYPLVQCYIDFLEMRVRLHSDSSFTAQSLSENCDPTLTQRLEGRFVVVDQRVITAAWIRPGNPR